MKTTNVASGPNRSGDLAAEALSKGSKKNRKKKRKNRANANPQPQQAPKPQASFKKMAYFGAGFVAAAAVGIGLYQVDPSGKKVPEPQKVPDPGLGAMKDFAATQETNRLVPVDPGLPERPESWRREALQIGLRGDKDLAEKIYQEFGAAKNFPYFPQGECLSHLSKPNPGTSSIYNGFNDDAAKRFDQLAVERRAAEQRVDKDPLLKDAFKITPQTLAGDRFMNVRYLSKEEREACVVKGGANGEILDNKGKRVRPGRYNIVVDLSGKVYMSPIEQQAAIHHSSFTAGGPVFFAGEIEIGDDYSIEEIKNHSGHYRPSTNGFRALALAFEDAAIRLASNTRLVGVGYN